MKSLRHFTYSTWESAPVKAWRSRISSLAHHQIAGIALMLAGTLCVTLLIALIDSVGVILPNPGLIYLPLVAMLGYHWGIRQGIVAALLELCCVYFFFIAPRNTFKSLTAQGSAQLVTLAAVTVFMLAIVQLARHRRKQAEQEATRLAALNKIGTALASELNEQRLLRLIAETAREITGAGFAAFTLRPLDAFGQPLVPSEGNLFRLAAVVGVSPEEEERLRRMALGGEGLLAPIFRYGVPVRVSDALEHAYPRQGSRAGHARAFSPEAREEARRVAFEYAHEYTRGQAGRARLRYMGIPRGHPLVRSFLGAPLLDRDGQVRGGLLLGHAEPNRFTVQDEALLVGLATQAAVALENARLYHAARTQAQELDTIFESIADGVTLVDEQGRVLRENRTARRLRDMLGESAEESPTAVSLLGASSGEQGQGTTVEVSALQNEQREYFVSVAPLRQSDQISGPLHKREGEEGETSKGQEPQVGAVVVWHDVTEVRRLLTERRAHAETEARRALLQTVMDELPSGVYLVRGRDARLVMANRTAAALWGAVWKTDQPMAAFLEEHHIRVFHEDGHPLALDEFATMRALSGESVRHYLEIIRQPYGTTLPVLVNAIGLDARMLGLTAMVGTEPQPAAIVVHQDVTALKEAERLKDEFIGIAAHELRTPLSVLKGFVQMLLLQTARGNGPQLADWQMEAIQDIDRATARLVELTEDLLDVTRLQAGRLNLHLEPHDLVALTRRVVARLQITSERHSIVIRSHPEYVVANVDVQRFEQVLTNIVNNAIKYSPEGGEIDILVRAELGNNTAVISVQDHGIGIPASQQGRIFGRFMRADNAREIGGTGLGLYLCRELVERHGGRIWFESSEGQGSTFYISLPLVVESTEQDNAPGTIETAEQQRL